jgi:2-phospho-L-lactate/phosphoenolpyruvate guanylyltransferase
MTAFSTRIDSRKMVRIVVPFRGHGGKSRLGRTPEESRALALAMLGDVLAACIAVGRTLLVTDDDAGRALAAELGAEVADDAGGGQGAAVASALRGLEPGPVLVVNADLPCVVPEDLRQLLAATPAGGVALVEAADGTTNALGLPSPETFAPLYGAGSAGRFRAHAEARGLLAHAVPIRSLAEDVDTIDDLRRLQLRAGPRTQAALAYLFAEAS